MGYGNESEQDLESGMPLVAGIDPGDPVDRVGEGLGSCSMMRRRWSRRKLPMPGWRRWQVHMMNLPCSLVSAAGRSVNGY